MLATEVNSRADRADEEANLLAWVISGRVDGDGRPYSGLGAGGAVLSGLDMYSRLKYVVEIEGAYGLLNWLSTMIPSASGAIDAAVTLGASGRALRPGTGMDARLAEFGRCERGRWRPVVACSNQ